MNFLYIALITTISYAANGACDVELTGKNSTFTGFELSKMTTADAKLQSLLSLTWYNAAMTTLALFVPVILLAASLMGSKSLKSVLTASDSEETSEVSKLEPVMKSPMKDRLVYGEHDKSELPDTPIDVINLCLDEAKGLTKDVKVAEKLSQIQRLSAGIDAYC
eukprot:UN24809